MRDSTISSRVIKISLSVIATHSLKYKVTRNFFFPINASTWLSLSIEDSACGLLHASMTHGDTSARIWTPDSHLHTWFRYEFRIGNIFNSCIFLVRRTFANIYNVLPYMIVRTVRENRENVIQKKEEQVPFNQETRRL